MNNQKSAELLFAWLSSPMLFTNQHGQSTEAPKLGLSKDGNWQPSVRFTPLTTAEVWTMTYFKMPWNKPPDSNAAVPE